jgi:hypothetical protein
MTRAICSIIAVARLRPSPSWGSRNAARALRPMASKPLAEAQATPFFSPDLKVWTVSMSFIARLAAPFSAIWR